MIAKQLLSFHIAERESGNNYLTWTYPTITEELKQHLPLKCFSHPKQEYVCSRKNNTWIYIKRFNKNLALIVLANEFEPIKYKLLCDILSRKFADTGNPVDLVKIYLDLFSSGSCSAQESGSLFQCDFNGFVSRQNLKEFIQRFQLETVLIYNAILLKRRVLVFNSDAGSLMKELFSIAHLVGCRNPKDFLYPLIVGSMELKGLSFYVAGTTDLNLEKENKLYDLFVNMETSEIAISPQAEEILKMTKMHKELATVMVKLAQSDCDDAALMEEISNRTNGVLKELQELASVASGNVKMVTINDLKFRKLNTTLENFFFNLAIAENIMML